MNVSLRPQRRRVARLLVSAAGVAGLALIAAYAAGDERSNQNMTVTAIEDAKFTPVDRQRPQGAQIAVLWGDPNAGPSAMLLRINKGAGAMHVHSADYHCVILEGTMQHWEQGQTQAQAKQLQPGSHWFQPGNAAHSDACLTEQCLMYVQWAGRRDGRLAESAKDESAKN